MDPPATNNIIKMIWQFQILLSCLVLVFSADLEAVRETIEQAKQQVWAELTGQEWVYPTYLGTMFLSEYYLELQALNLSSKFRVEEFTRILLDSQLADGSWHQVEDAYIASGQLDATLFNYWYLKSVGISSDEPNMQKARQWILQNGGIEGVQTMSKFKLAVFGQFPWSQLFQIPLFIFYENLNPLYIKKITAQWVYPHMTALAYLQHVQKVYHVGADISELYLKGKPTFPPLNRHVKVNRALKNLVQEILRLRQPLGSFGGYTVSTLLSMMALDDFRSRSNLYAGEISQAISKGLEFCEFNYFNPRVPYQGSLDDGRWWDTILISWSLLEAGENPEKLLPIVENMILKGVQANGGIEYGYDFGYAPDADDTGLLLAVLSHYPNQYGEAIRKSEKFLEEIQNPDGGFPAFDKGKMGKNVLYEYAFRLAGISDSAEIFDPSSPDVTAHILEGMASSGAGVPQKLLNKALQYLRETQEEWGSWEGRWGINHIYAVGAVLPALKKVNYNMREAWVKKAVSWLQGRQNEDGGFGETTLSYLDAKSYAGVGVSTVSQTSWGLLGLLAVREEYQVEESIDHAVQYLVRTFKAEGEFVDHSVVGTGHRGLLYLQYPSYAKSFPVLALSRYLKTNL